MADILTIDCGGSKCALALWQSDCSGRPQPRLQRQVPTDFADEQGLLPHLQKICEGRQLAAAVLAVAGPTASADGRLRLTNNPCVLDPAALQRGLPQIGRWAVLNDLEAFAHALPALTPGEMQSLNPGAGPGLARGVCLAAAVGTGLGVALHLPNGCVLPSEAGNSSFAPEGRELTAVWQSLRGWLAAPRCEDILAGVGLTNIFRAVCPPELYRPLQPAEITACARGEGEQALQEVCRRVMVLFSAAAGVIMRNLALCFFSSGGIYLGGGVIAKLGPLFDAAAFRGAFLRPCPLQEQLARMPVWLLNAGDTVSLGAACYADRLLLG